MTTTFKTVTTSIGLAVFAATFAPLATAGCGDIPGKPPASLRLQPPYLMQAAYRPARLVLASDKDPAGAAIVGLWAVTFTVGEKTGHSSYKLNHVALSYDAATGALNGIVSVREWVTVDHTGNNYQGNFTIDVVDPNKNPVGHVAGEITGERITADQ
jgi:hypothetical protein